MFRGINDLSGRMLELYKMRRDGSYFDQQQFLHMLREEEAATAENRAVEREGRAFSVRAEEAERANEYEIARDWRQAQISVHVKAEQDRLDRGFENSPFSYSPEELHDLVSEQSGGGSRPVLLVAPYFDDEKNSAGNDDGPQAFRVAIRRAWLNSPWAGDVACFDGAMKRPLRNADADILLLQRALRDLPVILVYGDVQTGRRVWPTLVAWNMVEAQDFRSIHINFPHLSLPVESADEEARRSSRLAFEDELGESTAVTVAVLAEWFHLARYGRRPRLHETLPADRGLERRAAALGLTAAYEVAVDRGRISVHEARVEQAALFRAAGLHGEARSAAMSVIAPGAAEYAERLTPDVLRRLRDVVAEVGTPDQAAAAGRLLEDAARRSTMRSLGW
ncbi:MULTISPECIES: hypothetical protein [Streptomyces]|jgi:hypothetical protein|uniref:Uncharacterized protein n=1 Tax=Streptomyces nymphaeiformis TaxID=2663842 RepID=A0A7W7U1P2_9ACTN|nr:hypothetical protein [Streptomyces nymphaeiformis]MBB4983407.1 hypothetical protein [Streptomyces nymphaeiformis]